MDKLSSILRLQQSLFHFLEEKKLKEGIIIKLISQKDFEKLIKDGVIGQCHMDGNNSAVGKYSCGFYDVKKYNIEKRKTPDASDKYLKTIVSHVGVAITRNKIYIEDSYVK